MEGRKELCASGKDHLTSYADLSLPFAVWIKGAESRLQSDAKLPKRKEQLLKEKEELDVSLKPLFLAALCVFIPFAGLAMFIGVCC